LNPAFAAGQFFFVGDEKGPVPLAGKQFQQDVRSAAVGNHHGDARRSQFAGGPDLAEHPSLAESTRDITGVFFDSFIEAGDQRDQLRIRVNPGILVIQPIDVRQVDQQVGIHQQRDHGRQGVVVPELDLLDHDRIVFVDDGNHLPIQQRVERVAGIEIAFAVGQVFTGEQNLGHLLLLLGKCLFVFPHQTGLAHGGHRLTLWNLIRSSGQLQPPDSGGHGPGGNQDHFHSFADQGADLTADGADRFQIQSVDFGQHVAADLDDHPAGRFKALFSLRTHGGRPVWR